MAASYKWDVVLLTAEKFLTVKEGDWYAQQVIQEDRLVSEALERQGLKVLRTNWDDPQMKWEEARSVLFRTTWDYFDRFDEFEPWFKALRTKTTVINPAELINWNMDKHYLQDLETNGVAVCPTLFVEAGDTRTLSQVLQESGGEEFVIKPAISGAGRHTYRLKISKAGQYQSIYAKLIADESMLIQPFQHNVVQHGEISLILIDGKYQHAVLKKAKEGDFRVQDDFGGSVYHYEASEEEKALAERAIAACPEKALYARADIIRDNDNELCISELELIEPELWFRNNTQAADYLANAITQYLNRN